MGQIVQVQSGQSQIVLGKVLKGSLDKFVVSDDQFDRLSTDAFTAALTDLGPSILSSAPVSLSTVSANNTAYATLTPGFAGTLRSVAAIVTTAASTAAKSATLQAFIDQDGAGSAADVAVNGGILALTTALVTPAGKVIPGTNIKKSAANPNEFGKDAVIKFKTTALPTTFVEGAVIFVAFIDPAPAA